MKKFYQLILSITLIASANNVINGQTTIVCDTSGLTITDAFPQFSNPSSSLSLYQFLASDLQVRGYWFGTSFDPNPLVNFIGNAQAYENTQQTKIVGVLSLFGSKSKNVNNPNPSSINFRIHDMVEGGALDNVGTPQAPVFGETKGPSNTPLGTASLTFEEIDVTVNATSSANWLLNFVPFSNPVTVNGDYAISVDYQSMKTALDTIALYSDGPGDGVGLKYTFHRVLQPGSDPTWITTVTYMGNAGNCNIGMFAVLNCDTTTVEPNSVIDLNNYSSMSGMKAVVYPNPAIDNAMLAIELSQAGDYSIEIYDLQGRKMNTNVLGFRNAGNYTETLDITGLNSGNYIFSLINENGTRFTKMFVKQ
jgi:hypothetical protein